MSGAGAQHGSRSPEATPRPNARSNSSRAGWSSVSAPARPPTSSSKSWRRGSRRGLAVVAIPTSEHTAGLARRLGIPLASFAEHRRIDLAIDGADEVERSTLDLIKGHGGALLREKIVAAASQRFIVVVDQEKLVDRLGEHMPVPVEVAQFGWQATAAALERLGAAAELRRAGGQPFVTDGGNFILDCHFGPIDDPRADRAPINMTVGVVENGLFIGRSSAVIVATDSGVDILTRSGGRVP